MKVNTAKVTFKLTICHQRRHSIGHIQFRISLPLQLCLYLAQFPRYYDVFPKIYEVTHVTLNAYLSKVNLSCAHLVLLCVNQYRAKLKTGHVTLTTGVVYHPKTNTWYILRPVYKNWRLSLQPFRHMITSVEIENRSSCDPCHASFRGALSTESSDSVSYTHLTLPTILRV